MITVIFQPPYPTPETTASAEVCQAGMRTRLDELVPGEQDLVLLPEYANAPGLNERALLREFAQAQGAEFLQAVSDAAGRLGCAIALAAAVPSGARWFNRTLVFDERGDEAFTYDKIHLTDVERDDLGLTPGSTNPILQHGEIRIGFATCFDVYFPEHFATLAAQGADLVLCPSYQRSDPADRIRTLSRMRALDSGCYVLRSSYAMDDPSVGGRSLVAAPDGTLSEDAGANACVISVEFDPQAKFDKPASLGQPHVEHRTLIETHRRPETYRGRLQRTQQIAATPFPHLCAHRGLSEACPENTLPAFAAAIALGVHEVEFDVWSCRDDVLVICHDATVDRTSDGTGKVTELSWDEIRRLDAGIYCGEAWRGIRMPRLEEVLDATGGRVVLNVHVQCEGAALQRICDLLSERGLTTSAYIAAHTESALQTAFEYAAEIPRACLVGQKDPDGLIEMAERYECRRLQFGRSMTEDHGRRAHELGLICNLYGSDDAEDGREYVARGIDVILTNRCNVMIAGGFEALSPDSAFG